MSFHLGGRTIATRPTSWEPRFAADADTVALWHLDEGSGSVALDSGPSQLSGSIFGASLALAPIRSLR